MGLPQSEMSGVTERGRHNNEEAVMCQTSAQNKLLFKSSARLIATSKKRAAETIAAKARTMRPTFFVPPPRGP